LITEQKNLKNAKKADGAILRDGQPIAVIELKSMRTVDLQTIEIQAFAYKNHQPTARYVITANFQKLRFYIDDATEFEEFDLFALTESHFHLLYACLHKAQLLADAPAQLKIASLHKTEQITQDLYVDYSKFKAELFLNLKQWNRSHDALTLFKKSQKLLDRFLFFCFAKDKGLLHRETLKNMLNQYDTLKTLDEAKPLYDIFKKYFHYLNAGYAPLNIFGYNGGLFAPDPLLDGLTISDGLLYSYIPTLGKYDFDSDVDTNILGHIFEHSLNELDEKTAQAVGQNADKSKSKRKKDGIFYTPRYITQYIVEQTIGALCKQKQVELAIDRLDWWENCPSATAIMRLHTYRGWLLQLTVLDPACGSGAFLNQAFVFLRAEHRTIDAMLATLTGKTVENTDWATHILDHNLFGVDINEESVEIAKLSLWLRTAKIGRKLNDLSANIQVGNSLISDPEVAGALAFDWQKGFPQVFEKGGFDVVIGNPPYGAALTQTHKDYLKKKYAQTSFGQIDTYKYFIECGTFLLKSDGCLSFIMPDSYLEKEYFKDLRMFITSSYESVSNIKLGDNVFSEVNLPTAILIVKKWGNHYQFKDLSSIKDTTQKIDALNETNNFNLENLSDPSVGFSVKKGAVEFRDCIPMIEIFDQVMGVKLYQVGKGKPKQTSLEVETNAFISKNQNEMFKYPFVSQGIQRYFYESAHEYVRYGEWLAEARKLDFFEVEKLVIREIVNPRVFATYIGFPAIVKNTAAVIIQKDKNFNLKFLLSIINSKLITYYIFNESAKSGNKTYPSFTSNVIKNIPIKPTQNQAELIRLADKMLSLNAQLREAQTDFLNLLTDSFPSLKVNKAVESWHESDFAALKKTMEKQKGVTIEDLNEVKKWRKQFDLEKKAYAALQQQIAATDKAIDAAVYALYELTPEEIQIIENQ
jgi:type I restriction-modification system DNA methylase subunit